MEYVIAVAVAGAVIVGVLNYRADKRYERRAAANREAAQRILRGLSPLKGDYAGAEALPGAFLIQHLKSKRNRFLN